MLRLHLRRRAQRSDSRPRPLRRENMAPSGTGLHPGVFSDEEHRNVTPYANTLLCAADGKLLGSSVVLDVVSEQAAPGAQFMEAPGSKSTANCPHCDARGTLYPEKTPMWTNVLGASSFQLRVAWAVFAQPVPGTSRGFACSVPSQRLGSTDIYGTFASWAACLLHWLWTLGFTQCPALGKAASH